MPACRPSSSRRRRCRARGGGLPIQYVLRTIGDSAQVYEVAEEISRRREASGRFIVVQNSLAFETPQAPLTIDRDRAAALGVPVSEIGTTLGALVGGAPISKFDRDNRSYDMITQVPAAGPPQSRSASAEYYVRAADGAMVPLSAVVTHRDGRRAGVDRAVQPAELGDDLGAAAARRHDAEGLATLRAIAQARSCRRASTRIIAGQSRLEIQEGNSIVDRLRPRGHRDLPGAGGAVRELPRSVHHHDVGAALDLRRHVSLNLGLGTLNIYTQVGLITLVGLITKHGILMVEFANEQQEKHGVSKREAIEEAARVRLRPILMTTAAMVLGVVPLLMPAAPAPRRASPWAS